MIEGYKAEDSSLRDILVVQFPVRIVNHNGKRYRPLGIVWHAGIRIHGTWPGTRRVERSPFTGGNRPSRAAAHYQH